MRFRKSILCLSALAMTFSLTAVAANSPSVAAGASQTYIVLYKTQSVSSDAVAAVSKAGGSIVAAYPQIGVVVATSTNTSFRSTVLRDSRVSGAAATNRFATRLDVDSAEDTSATPLPDSAPAADSDSLSGRQWDMVQIHAPRAHAITGGSPSVVVGDIDTGLDYTHPDLAANVDDADSVNCVCGVPVPGSAAAMDDNGHGTHTAGTIAAAANGIGIVGVAPNVKIAGIKAGNADGFFFPEAVVCAFMWAGTHGIDGHEQQLLRRPVAVQLPERRRAAGDLDRRAASDQYAQSKGVVVVAAEGNQADDLAHPTQDATSPDDTNPVCARSPTAAPSCRSRCRASWASPRTAT